MTRDAPHPLPARDAYGSRARRFLELFKRFAALFDHPFANIAVPQENRTAIAPPIAGAGGGQRMQTGPMHGDAQYENLGFEYRDASAEMTSLGSMFGPAALRRSLTPLPPQ